MSNGEKLIGPEEASTPVDQLMDDARVLGEHFQDTSLEKMMQAVGELNEEQKKQFLSGMALNIIAMNIFLKEVKGQIAILLKLASQEQSSIIALH